MVLLSGLWSGFTQHQFFLVVVINGMRGEEQGRHRGEQRLQKWRQREDNRVKRGIGRVTDTEREMDRDRSWTRFHTMGWPHNCFFIL